MEVVLLDIVQSNHCYYNLYSECAKNIEVPDDSICSKCITETHTSTRDEE